MSRKTDRLFVWSARHPFSCSNKINMSVHVRFIPNILKKLRENQPKKSTKKSEDSLVRYQMYIKDLLLRHQLHLMNTNGQRIGT